MKNPKQILNFNDQNLIQFRKFGFKILSLVRVSRLGFKVFIFGLCFCLCGSVLAQDNLETLKQTYFKQHNYSEFVQYLKHLKEQEPRLLPQINYYIALARYEQLKHLEATQNWDEYFGYANLYREELIKTLNETIDSIGLSDSIYLYSRLLKWQFYNEQQDDRSRSAREDLVKAVSIYSLKSQDLSPLKKVAKELSDYGKGYEAEKIYKIYAQRFIQLTAKSDELKQKAETSFREGNLSLSGLFYDAYIEKAVSEIPEQEFLSILYYIAYDFSFKDEGPNMPVYTEKIFKKIGELYGKDAFTEEMQYLRGYNLEKSKEYQRALEEYLIFMDNFPQSKYHSKTVYKAGIISAYILGDLERAKKLFRILADGSLVNPEVIASIYQLGLFAQWEKDFVRAKEYYQRLLTKAESKFEERVSLAKERMKELEGNLELEFNLRTFLDACLAKESAFNTLGMVELRATSHADVGKLTEILAETYALPESGCMPIELNFLWSGNLGNEIPEPENAKFSTSYVHAGTKEINLAVVTARGILARSIVMMDVVE